MRMLKVGDGVVIDMAGAVSKVSLYCFVETIVYYSNEADLSSRFHFVTPQSDITRADAAYIRGSRALKTHSKSVAYHYDGFNVIVTVSLSEQITSVHISKMNFIGEVVQEFVNYAQVGFPAGLIFIID